MPRTPWDLPGVRALSGRPCFGNRGGLGPAGGVCVWTAGAPLVKALPVNPTDPAVTGPDIFAKLVPMAAHEASSLYRWVPGNGPRERGRAACAALAPSSARSPCPSSASLRLTGVWRGPAQPRGFPRGATALPKRPRADSCGARSTGGVGVELSRVPSQP